MTNVYQLNNENNQKNPSATILTFLARKGQDSENTNVGYEKHIRDFFLAMSHKKVEDLLEEDLIFTPQEIEAYQVELRKSYASTSVNTKMSAIGECYTKLERDGFAVKASWFDVERFDEHDKKPYDVLTQEEVVQVIQLVSKTRKGAEKALLVRLAFATAFRKESLLTMKWSQIINRDGQWYAKVVGKGNKPSYKKITQDLYEALMIHKEKVKRDRIFTLSPTTVQSMIEYIRKNMDFGDRYIVFHSIKKASVEEVALLTNYDLKAMQAHGDHSDIKTTLNDYMAKKKFDDLVAVDVDRHIPVEEFDKLTHEELLTLVKSTDRNTQIKLLHALGKM